MLKSHLINFSIACLLLSTAACATSHTPVINDLRTANRITVETTGGRVAGYADGKIAVFFGIPYAAPTGGDNRFAPSRPAEKLGNMFPAVSFSPVAPQHYDKTEISSTFFHDEDCLSINLWTPAADGKKRPVIFYIHGGGFILGSTADPMYNGEQFARRGDVVFVSANYRLGSFGFLYLDFLGDEYRGSGNLGLQDQIAALKWVNANVEKFGGDPNNVTIMGESAGSISVTTMMAMPAAKGLFHKAIAESGAPNITRTREEAEKHTKVFMEVAGVNDVAGLRKLTTEEMIKIQIKFIDKYGLEADALFSPVIDGVIIPKNPFDAIAGGSAAGIPLLHGTTKDEFRYWIQYEPLIRVTPPETFFKYVPNFSKPFEAHQDRIIAHYKKTYSEASGGDISMMLATDIGFWIPHIRLAEAQSKHARTYMYMFTWPSPALDGVMGSPHGIELPFVFDILKGEGAEFYLGKSAPKKLAESSNDAWINFARTGVPSASGFPEWPAYDTEKRATMIIDEKSTVVYDPKKSDRELFKGIIY